MSCSSFACPWYCRAHPNVGRAFLVVGCTIGCDREKCAVWAAAGDGTRLMKSMETARKCGAVPIDWFLRLLAKAGEPSGELLHPLELELANLRHDKGLDPFYCLLWSTMCRDKRLPTDVELRDEGCVILSPAASLLYRDVLHTTQACVSVLDEKGGRYGPVPEHLRRHECVIVDRMGGLRPAPVAFTLAYVGELPTSRPFRAMLVCLLVDRSHSASNCRILLPIRPYGFCRLYRLALLLPDA